MFTDPQTQQLKAIIRDHTIADSAFATAVNALIADGVPAATTTTAGKIEIATNTETQTGTDTSRAITSANLTAKEATTAEFRGNTADRILTTDQVWAAGAEVALTDASTIAVNLSSGINFAVTLGGNRTLGNPTNTKVGQTGRIRVLQDGTGNRTLAFGSNYVAAGGVANLVLSIAASAVDYLYYDVRSSTEIFLSLNPDVKH